MLIASAMILAGGQGTRLGQDKKNLIFENVNILENLIKKLSSRFKEIFVSTNDGAVFDNAITLADEIGHGPLAGIHSGLGVCISEYLYVTGCDMPYLSLEYIDYLIKCAEKTNADAIVARRKDGYYEPFNAMYNKSALPIITKAINSGRYGLNRILDTMNLFVVEQVKSSAYVNGNMFVNINRKEDLKTTFT